MLTGCAFRESVAAMIYRHTALFTLLGGLRLQIGLKGGVLLCCLLLNTSAFAAVDTRTGATLEKQIRNTDPVGEQDVRPPKSRIPPREAFEACNGKKEGDTCRFLSSQGVEDGQCLSGVENLFACRPHRGPTSRNDFLPTSNSSRLNRIFNDLIPYVLVALAAAGLTWYGFSRYRNLPLRRLRIVTKRLAEGDLSARVGEGLSDRQDETANLGRDVDRMAARIENLVTSHHRLIRDVSHELRSPLARLNVALELARQSAGPAFSAPFERIERESERLSDLITQLLMLTKLESEGGTYRKETLDIAALISEVAQDADFEARNNDRRVVMTECAPLLLNGNPALLRQALDNLARNAVRYTATGTTVEITLLEKDCENSRWAHIEIRDHGPGVPESDLHNIFRPFFRIDDSRDRQSGGAGVGLAIADRAVRLHGGNLRAFNALDEGLIMEMKLPLAENL